MILARGFASLFLLQAVATLQAAPARLSAEQARHLLVRTGFAPTQEEVDRLVGKSAGQVVDQMLSAAKLAQPIHPAPEFVNAAAPTPFRLLAMQRARSAASLWAPQGERWLVGRLVGLSVDWAGCL